MRRQLYGDEDYKNFFEWILDEIKVINKKLEAGSAVLHHLEMFLMNVACNDPGAAIGANLVLPILQDRLDSLALEYAAEKAAEAEKAIIKMEVNANSIKLNLTFGYAHFPKKHFPNPTAACSPFLSRKPVESYV